MFECLGLSHDQLRGFDLGLIITAAYITLTYIVKSKEISMCCLAFIASELYCLSPLYSFTLSHSPSAVFLVYSAIYFTVIRYLSTYKVMLACFIMAVFELIVYKAYRDEIGIVWVEGFLYENYELLVTLCHLAIINSVLNWRKIINSVRDYCLPLFRFVGRYSCALPYGC